MVINTIEYLNDSAMKHPDKIAFADDKTSITYGELYRKGRRLGAAICKNVDARTNIVVLGRRSPSYIVMLSGIWYANCCCVPIDTELPIDRIRTILEQTHSDIVIYDDYYREQAESLPLKHRINLDEFDYDGFSEDDPDIMKRKYLDEDAACIYFTSGTSGVPKGSVICHRSLINLAEGLCDDLEYGEDEILAGQTPLYYVASLHDIMPAFKNAYSVFLIPANILMFPKTVIQFLAENKVTVLSMVPSILSHIASYGNVSEKELPYMRKILFGGEIISVSVIEKWKKACHSCDFYYCYGLTETTTTACFWKVDNNKLMHDDEVPIGNALRNVDIFLLDEEGNLAQEGEICFRGACLAKGYYGEEELTEKFFCNNPNNPYYHEKIYRTGDMGKYNEDGQIIFKGRRDYQIKVMGHRIELNDIENTVLTHKDVNKACCVYKGKIILYYEGEIEAAELKTYLERKIPKYMMPAKYAKIQIPLLSNGKMDRKKIRDME